MCGNLPISRYAPLLWLRTWYFSSLQAVIARAYKNDWAGPATFLQMCIPWKFPPIVLLGNVAGLVGGLEHVLFFPYSFIVFRGVGIPPTRGENHAEVIRFLFQAMLHQTLRDMFETTQERGVLFHPSNYKYTLTKKNYKYTYMHACMHPYIHYIALPYLTLLYITLHYITLHIYIYIYLNILVTFYSS